MPKNISNVNGMVDLHRRVNSLPTILGEIRSSFMASGKENAGIAYSIIIVNVSTLYETFHHVSQVSEGA